MKKTSLLNCEMSEVISKMGHNDLLAIGDCGLPIPDETRRIDVALTKNIPGFIETLKVVLTELEVEEVRVAIETRQVSPQIFSQIQEQIGKVKIEIITHEQLKHELSQCKAVIRTGEQTPYANILLKSGVVF